MRKVVNFLSTFVLLSNILAAGTAYAESGGVSENLQKQVGWEFIQTKTTPTAIAFEGTSGQLVVASNGLIEFYRVFPIPVRESFIEVLNFHPTNIFVDSENNVFVVGTSEEDEGRLLVFSRENGDSDWQVSADVVIGDDFYEPSIFVSQTLDVFISTLSESYVYTTSKNEITTGADGKSRNWDFVRLKCGRPMGVGVIAKNLVVTTPLGGGVVEVSNISIDEQSESSFDPECKSTIGVQNVFSINSDKKVKSTLGQTIATLETADSTSQKLFIAILESDSLLATEFIITSTGEIAQVATDALRLMLNDNFLDFFANAKQHWNVGDDSGDIDVAANKTGELIAVGSRWINALSVFSYDERKLKFSSKHSLPFGVSKVALNAKGDMAAVIQTQQPQSTGSKILLIKNPSISPGDFGGRVKSVATDYVQKFLNRLGFDSGIEDGVFGSNTSEAIKRFQESKNLVATGELDEDTKNLINKLSDEF